MQVEPSRRTRKLLNAVYTPSAGELAAVQQVTLTLTTTGNNGCTAVSDAVTYTFTPAPTANAGVDLFTCANNASVSLSGAITVATGALRQRLGYLYLHAEQQHAQCDLHTKCIGGRCGNGDSHADNGWQWNL